MVTWDTEPTFRDGLRSATMPRPGLIPIDAEWSRASGQALAEAQQRMLRDVSRPLVAQREHAASLQPAFASFGVAIRERLAAPLRCAAGRGVGNSAWDMAAVDRDAGSTSMFDWLFTLVAYAVAHPAIDLVVRAHPSETNVADDLKSRTPVGAEILRRFAPLPANIKRVDGLESDRFVRAGGHGRVVTVYTSRIGLEFALGIGVCGYQSRKRSRSRRGQQLSCSATNSDCVKHF